MKSVKKIFTAAVSVLAACCGLMFTACSVPSAEIVSFSFQKSKNSSLTDTISLSATVTGVIEDNIITVSLPSDVYADSDARAALVPTIVLADGASLQTKTSEMNFANNPVVIAVTSTAGDDAAYIVNIQEDHGSVSRGDLLFTEYYSGSGYEYKTANNQYIEIKNMSDEAIDLGCVQLVRHAWEDGVRKENEDQTVTLYGTLNAGKIAVIYSQRCTFFSSKTSSSDGLYISDDTLNSIISFTGEDGLELKCGSKVLDVLGPEAGYGNGWNWGVSKRMLRKSSVTTYTKWNENQWISYAAANATTDTTSIGSTNAGGNAGIDTIETGDSDKDLTYFALEGLDEIIYGTINNTSKTVTIELPQIISSKQYISVSTSGKRVRVVGQKSDVVSGETSVNLARGVQLRVWDQNDDYEDYDINYTVANYNFETITPGTSFTKISAEPVDGETVLIFHPVSDTVLGSKSSSTSLKAVECDAGDELGYSSGMACLTLTDAGTASLTVNNVSYSNRKAYYLTVDGKFLNTIKKSNGNFGLAVAALPNDYSRWCFVETETDGVFWLVNADAQYNSANQCLEYYNDTYSSYGYQSSQANIYEYYLYRK